MPNGERKVRSFVAYPEVPNKAHAVIVIHEIFGLTDWVRGVADQLAEAGYIAIAPDLLSGMGPERRRHRCAGRPGRRPRRDRQACRRTRSPADLNAVAKYVDKLPAGNGTVVGGRLLLGRRAIVPLRDEQQGSQGRLRLLRLAARRAPRRSRGSTARSTASTARTTPASTRRFPRPKK